MGTTIFTVPVQIAADIEGTAFPPHPVTNVPPDINPWNFEAADESIIVVSRTSEDNAVAEWASMGALGKHERYIVDVIVTTQVRGQTWGDMMARLAELTETVLDVFTDADGQFLPPGGLSGANENPFNIFTGMAAAEQSDQFAGDEGWAGQCRVAVRIAARI